MSDIASNVKQFTVSVNQQYPGCSLFQMLSLRNFSWVYQKFNDMLEGSSVAKYAARQFGSSLRVFRFESSFLWLGRTVESGYLAHFVIWRTSSIRRMSYSCLNSIYTCYLAPKIPLNEKMGGARY